MTALRSNHYFAEHCARLGLHVFPCGSNKKPRVKWRAESTTDREQIRAWWTEWPDALPAIDLSKSGHVVIDGDRHGGPDGVAAAEQLFAERATDLAAIPTVITPSGGKHFYFIQPAGEPIGNSDKPLRDKAINVRGDGGYVIAPGAQLPDGNRYSHDKSSPNIFQAMRNNTVPVLPAWLATLLQNGHAHDASHPVNGASPPSGERHRAYAHAALERICDEIASAREGQRNTILNNAAFRMGTMIANGWIDRSDVEHRLIDAATACGLARNEIGTTLRSGLDAGEKEPHRELQDRPQPPRSSNIEQPAPESIPLAPLPWLDMSNWDTEHPPRRQWAILDRVPLKQAGLLSGEGGTGKSIIELMKDIAHVAARDWLGSLPEPGPAFYIGAEDDKDELHIRLAAIAEHYGVTFKQLIDGGLHVLCLLGQDATLCAATGKSGKVTVTDLYRQIFEAAGDIKPKNISIDTLSRAFAGNEIDRVQVYTFAMHMQALAMVAGGSVTVLSHPSLSGIASGSGISGSTAWHGAFRFRQYLTGIKPDAGEQPDNDLRQLEFKKNQYGPTAETIVLRYQRGLFLPQAGTSSLDKIATEQRAEETLLTLLAQFTQQGRNVSDKPTANAYAPTMFAKERPTKNQGIRKSDLEAAMRRLFEAGKIRVEPYGPPSRGWTRLVIA